MTEIFKHRFRLKAALLSGLLGFFIDSSAVAATADASGDDAIKRLEELNAIFRKQYAQSKKEIIASTDPVILIRGGKAILLWKGKREECEYIEPQWDVLKMIDHIPLGLFVMLSEPASKGQKLQPETLLELEAIKVKIEQVEERLQNLHFSLQASVRQRFILDQSVNFLTKVLAQEGLTRTELEHFSHKMAGPSLENAYEAASLELSSLDKKIQAWRQKMGEEPFKVLSVIICGRHMPREKEITFQYFQLLLGEKREGRRLIYMEGPGEDNDALDLFATHRLDRSIAIAYFKDPWRMHRDLLSDGAKRYLREHPPLK